MLPRLSYPRWNVAKQQSINSEAQDGTHIHWWTLYTVNWEYFDVKIFSDSMACVNTCAILMIMQ